MIDKSNKKFWDKFAKLYAPCMKKNKGVYDRVCEYNRPHLNKDMEVLELVCGVRSFLSYKFDITKHKNYKLLEDYDERNGFDIEKYITRKGKTKINGNTVITRL